VAKAMYSTEEVANVLGLHVRTVRGYVRDGRLPAVRIGKQYRIARDDLNAFAGGHAAAPAGGAGRPPRAEVSAVVAIDPVSPDAMNRLSTLVMGAAATGREDSGRLRVQTIYDPDQASLKIIVIGAPDDAAAVLAVVGALTRERA
jgi:excisionase family DNA binding protein